jgi:hypothetical protein
VLQPALNLKYASRMPAFTREGQGVRLLEIGTLMMCGVVSATIIGCFQIRGLRIPGHVILGAVLPMSLGLALVPRRMAGGMMSLSAAATAAVMYFSHWGNVQITGFVSLVVLGPLLDLAAWGSTRGWRLYTRFVVAGGIANLIAFGARWLSAVKGWEIQGSRRVLAFWPSALTSFILCGAAAGLISAIVWFRWRARNDLHRA